MSSQHKVQANRENARSSTGPRTATGKAQVAGNARRHGLATPIWSDATLANEAEQLARRIAGPDPSAQILAQARRVAEAQVDIARIRRMRRAILEPALTNASYWPRKRK
jgi:hypothetical protein